MKFKHELADGRWVVVDRSDGTYAVSASEPKGGKVLPAGVIDRCGSYQSGGVALRELLVQDAA